MGALFDDERWCEFCHERFWGSHRSKFCSQSCRSKNHRAERTRRSDSAVVDACRELVERADDPKQGSVQKLVPLVFRAAAAELKRAGHDPLTFLMTLPDDPATDEDTAPGGIEDKPGGRRRWLHTPEVQLAKLRNRVVERELQGMSAAWHKRRIAKLEKLLAAREGGKAQSPA